ncbi:hypothetical protein [Actinomadura sp. NTSP31]|uniref:hypothetical protein n=1 Tax=Actinomadura sp. NTSP31 TaxID=1735447 RepID=UPI0035C08940
MSFPPPPPGAPGPGAPGAPGGPGLPPIAGLDEALNRSYPAFTRKPVVYLPVVLAGETVGYLWAAVTDRAAGFIRRNEALERAWETPMVWQARLDEAHRQGLPAREAIRRWIGAPQDPKGGGIPAGSREERAASLTDLQVLANPGLPPEPGPLVQDGEYPDGTPADRSKGFGPLSFTLPPTYPDAAAGPVRYLPVTRGDVVLGYLWAAVGGNAASYLGRDDAGIAGTNAGGPLIVRLRDAYAAGVPALQAVRDCKGIEGGPSADAPEEEAASLDDLRRLASRHTQSLRLVFPDLDHSDLTADPAPPVPAQERDAILRYLEQAPVVYDSGNKTADMLVPARPSTVPVAYHTDGTFVWAAGVAFYLRVHDLPPAADLVGHMRGNGFRVPEVGAAALADANRTLEWNAILKPPPPPVA